MQPTHMQFPWCRNSSWLRPVLCSQSVPVVPNNARECIWADQLISAVCVLYFALSPPSEALGRRSEYKPHTLRWPDVEGEALTGKQFILPATDVRGHPVLVLRPR